MRSIAVCLLLLTQSMFALSVSDQKAIEQILQDQESSWNLAQCRGFGRGYADHADFVNIFGMKFSGKEEIEKRHIHILQTFLQDTKFTTLETSLREVLPHLVIANVYWQVTNFRTPKMDLSQPGQTQKGLFTHVFVKNNNEWKIESSQNTLLTAP